MTQGVLTEERVEQLYREILGDESEEDPVRWRKRMRILRAATELFVRHGFRKTSVDEIAQKAEVAKGTVYLYFPNKGALLLQAVTLEKRAYLDLLRPLFDGSIEPRRRLAFFIRTGLEVTHTLPLVSRLLRDDADLQAALDALDPETVAERQALGEEWIAELIEQAAPDVFSDEEKRARAAVLIDARYFIGLMTPERLLGRGRPVAEIAQTLADMIVWGTARRPPDEAP